MPFTGAKCTPGRAIFATASGKCRAPAASDTPWARTNAVCRCISAKQVPNGGRGQARGRLPATANGLRGISVEYIRLMPPNPLVRRARPWFRRSLGGLVLVLQAAMATSGVWEPRVERWLGTHMEQDGTRHVTAHNEATCLLCSARAQSSLPTLPDPLLHVSQLAIAVAPQRHAAPSVTDTSPLRSRAPPSLLA